MVFAIGAYVLWGMFPLYFALLTSVSPLEIVAHRAVWSLLFVLILIAIFRQWADLRRALTPRTIGLLAAAIMFLSINWLVYVYAIDINEVVQGALGYFINPLVSVALGVILLSERLGRTQWLAIGIAALAVLVLTISYGGVPWISLTLAFSFGLYGLIKKRANVDALPSLAIETAVITPIAVAYLWFLEAQGEAAFIQDGLGISVLLVLLGPITAIPLLAFGAAAIRIPLSTLGIIQYVTPTVIFLLGITVFGESMPALRWVGFGLVWIALVIFTADAWRRSRVPVIEPD
ncbi:MAG: EamA family transporter RarD [Actinomycetota bacterium]